MTTKTETVQTQYGDVGFEVVECDSCGITVRKNDAVDVIADDVVAVQHWSHKRGTEYEIANERRSHCCRECVDNRYFSLSWRVMYFDALHGMLIAFLVYLIIVLALVVA